jgi:hypothetical protein
MHFVTLNVNLLKEHEEELSGVVLGPISWGENVS